MKIVCIADTHRDYHQLVIPPADVLIHAGDIDIYGMHEELTDFIAWLNKQKQVGVKIIIAGNHDCFIANHEEQVAVELKEHCIYLCNSGFNLDGFNVWGSPITPTFGEWGFMADRGSEIRKYWEKIPQDTDILITHGPPYGIMDEVVRPDFKTDHVGCTDLLNYVYKIKPAVHVFGHIHSGYGKKQIGDTLYVNASVMNEEYDVVNEPIIIEV